MQINQNTDHFTMTIRDLQFGALVAAFFLLLRIQYVSSNLFILISLRIKARCFVGCFFLYSFTEIQTYNRNQNKDHATTTVTESIQKKCMSQSSFNDYNSSSACISLITCMRQIPDRVLVGSTCSHVL